MLVGLGGFEPPTPRLSSVCSNQLSYRPSISPNSTQTLAQALIFSLAYKQSIGCEYLNEILLKGGDPAAGSPTATLLRLHPSHEPHRGKRPPCG